MQYVTVCIICETLGSEWVFVHWLAHIGCILTGKADDSILW